MTLDEIMEKEKFNDIEKALVNQSSLTHAEKIKIISGTKNAKSNDRQSEKMVQITTVIFAVSVMDAYVQITEDKPTKYYILFGILLMGLMGLLAYST